MALTQVSSEGIKDDAIKDVKIPANAVGNAELKDDAVGVNELSATGTPSSSTFLRGDNTWTAPTSHSIGDGGLTTNDFTNADHTKLDGIEANATADQTGGEIKTLYEEQTNTNAFTDADHTKLDGIATSANNYSHPTTAGNVHVPSGGSSGQVLKYSSAGTAQWGTDNNTTYTAGTGLNLSGTEFSVTSLALTTVQEAANESAMLGLTTQEGDVVVRTDENKSYVKNAGTAGSMSDFTLLRTPTDAVLSINGNTGAISAAQIASAVEAASDSNTFTDADHTKLNAIEASATADQTGAEIKSAYEGESDTNAFTDADHTKLDGIAAGAEVNVQSDWNSSSGDNQILNKPTLVSALNDLSDVSASSPSADQIIKWNGSAWALATDGGSAAGGVSQNIIVTLSESIDGSRTDFSMSTTPATAQNLTVSINGVIQKPNAGTTISNSSQGYCISGSTLKFATAPANGSTVFVVAQTAASGGSTDLEFNDNAKAKFGTGNDLEIFHDGTESWIKDTGTGDLNILASDLQIKTADDSAFYMTAVANGAVSIYHAGTKKLESTAGGVTISGTDASDGTIIKGDLRLNKEGETATRIKWDGSEGTVGHLELYDDVKLTFGAGPDLQIFHDTSGASDVNRIRCTNSHLFVDVEDSMVISVQADANGENGEVSAKFLESGPVELYHDGVKRFNTETWGATLHRPSGGSTTLEIMGCEGQDAVLNLIADDGDDHADFWRIQATHVGNEFAIQTYAGGSWQTVFRGTDARSAELWYQGSTKLVTTTNGITIAGDIRFNNSTWTGESSTGKIQTHSNHMYLQAAGGSWNFRTTGGTNVASINNSGSYSSSDERRKKDITTITGAVNTIKQLTGRSFTWKEDDKKSFGVIAQEVEPVLPELVMTQSLVEGETNSDPLKSVNYGALTGHFIEAIKELTTKIETLETKVAALEAK